MGWADHHIAKVRSGETVSFRPRGHSMTGRINSGQLVTVAPLQRDPQPDDIVLCTVRGTQYLHLVRAVEGERVLIANNHGHVNGWTNRAKIYGIVVAVGD